MDTLPNLSPIIQKATSIPNAMHSGWEINLQRRDCCPVHDAICHKCGVKGHLCTEHVLQIEGRHSAGR